MQHVIFSMLGSTAWLLIGGVNRQWRDLYAAMAKQKETSTSCTVASLATYEYAKLCGREFTDFDAAAVGQHAGLDVIACCAADMRLYTILRAAFESRRADMLQLLQALGAEACRSASEHEGEDDDSKGVLCLAAEHGSLECLRFLALQEGFYHIKDSGNIRCFVSVSAAIGGHLPTLQWLQQHEFLQEDGLFYHLCDTAASGGHMEAVVWLHEQGFALGQQACSKAAEAGNYQLLQWLRSHGLQWRADDIGVAAAAGGRVEILQFLRDSAVGDWHADALFRHVSSAAYSGRLAALQWLRSNGVQLTGNMWERGQCWPHVHTLRWAIEETDIVWGTAPAKNTCYLLYKEITPEAWKWAHENGCPCDCNGTSPPQYEEE
jgi:hypothetical protein